MTTAASGSNQTAVAFSVDVPAFVQDMLQVLPQTTHLYVVIGNSPIERYWVGQIDASLRVFNNRLSITWLTDLPFNDLLTRVAALPPQSIILFTLVSPDVVGVPKDEDTALERLHQAAKAPIFTYLDAYFGKGVVGGPMISGEAYVREAADAAIRLLRGERASDVSEPPLRLAAPQFDWRELRRWNIRQSDLPRGSVIRFREPAIWERYRWQIVSVLTLVLLETALIFALLYERRRRRGAEIEARQRIAELAHMNRRSTVGALSASIAHQLSQPLGAILRNSEAAEQMLDTSAPDIGTLKDIVADIQRDEHRASEVIRRLRGLLAKAPVEFHEIDLNRLVSEVFDFLSAQALACHIALITCFDSRAPLVCGDRIQLQQVILNLVVNGIEAIGEGASAERKIVGRTAVLDGASAEVAIEDSGPGIPDDELKRLFEPFFTTKKAGMGMGLSIAHAIVDSHGGQISADNRRGGGAIFRFRLPLAQATAIVEGKLPGLGNPLPSDGSP